jgi:UDP-N-acetylglucosamine acyltransferase
MNYIHPTAIIYDNVELGDNIYIGPYCIIGAPGEHRGFWDYKVSGRVIISSNCVLTGHVTIDSGTENNTILDHSVWMLKHSHVGHDAWIGKYTTISCGAKIGGHAIIGSKCNIGLNAVIHQRQIIAAGCMIGMGAVVTKKLITKPYQKYAGNPAKWLGPNEPNK